MIEVKQALVAKVMADTGSGSLTALLADGAGGVSFFQRGAEKEEQYPLLTYFCVTAPESEAIPMYDEIYQFDVWSRDIDLTDVIAARLRRVLHKKPLPATGVRVARVLKFLENDDYLTDPTPLYRKIMQFRIISFADDGVETGN